MPFAIAESAEADVIAVHNRLVYFLPHLWTTSMLNRIHAV